MNEHLDAMMAESSIVGLRDPEPTLFNNYSGSRYVICADVTDPSTTPNLVFLAHIDKTFYWTSTGDLPLVCYGDTLLEMKDLMTAALEETEPQTDALQLINIRPYLMTSTLSGCYDEYLTAVKKAEDKDIWERYERMLSDGFTDAERARIKSQI